MWKEKCDLESRKNFAKERLITELRESSKILEDQLRLMDEKYLELRIKLDWTREHGMKKLKRAEQMASQLRMKYVMSHGGSLDSVSLPTGMLTPLSASASDAGGSSFAGGYLESIGEDDGGGRRKKKNKFVFLFVDLFIQRLLCKHFICFRLKFRGDPNGDDGASGAFSTGTEITFEQIQDKLQRKMGEKEVWTEQKARDLAKTR